MDNFMILGVKRITGAYEGKPYDFCRLYISREIDSQSGSGWENYVDDYHNKVKTDNLPDVLGIANFKSFPDILNRPCHIYFNKFGGIEKVLFND